MDHQEEGKGVQETQRELSYFVPPLGQSISRNAQTCFLPAERSTVLETRTLQLFPLHRAAGRTRRLNYLSLSDTTVSEQHEDVL